MGRIAKLDRVQGIGRGIALELAAKGYSVAVNYAGNVVAANETCEKCTALATSVGQKFIPIQADISSADARKAMVETVVSEFGRFRVGVRCRCSHDVQRVAGSGVEGVVKAETRAV